MIKKGGSIFTRLDYLASSVGCIVSVSFILSFFASHAFLFPRRSYFHSFSLLTELSQLTRGQWKWTRVFLFTTLEWLSFFFFFCKPPQVQEKISPQWNEFMCESSDHEAIELGGPWRQGGSETRKMTRARGAKRRTLCGSSANARATPGWTASRYIKFLLFLSPTMGRHFGDINDSLDAVVSYR